MVIGVCLITIQIPHARSLKDKRQVVRSVTNRVKSRFNVSIAEVDYQEVWQTAEIGFAAVSNSARHADDTVQTVLRFIEENLLDGFVADVHTENIHLS